MMGDLAQAIRQVNERELDASELALASCFPPPPAMTPEAHTRLIPFVQWCEQERIRPLPARPTSVAAYAQYQQDQGVSQQVIAERLEAIEQLHFAAAMANPCATPVVRKTTGGSTIEPPRSWRSDEKLSFYELPIEIQAVVARREQDREKALRRAQNEAAELRRLQAVAAKPADTTTEGTEMAKTPKWNGEQGSSDMEKDPLKKDSSGLGYHPPKDIERRVNPSAERDGGFSSKLDRSE